MISTVRTCVAAALARRAGWGCSAGPRCAGARQAGRIVCWKDKSGKVVGCGDKVPPEYQDSATREMDRRGVTRGTTESAEEAARRRAQEQEAAKQKAEEAKRLAEQKRQDAALLNTFSNEKEIDQKRDRDLQQLDLQLDQFKVSLKNATDRHSEAKTRSDAGTKDKKTAEVLKEDLDQGRRREAAPRADDRRQGEREGRYSSSATPTRRSAISSCGAKPRRSPRRRPRRSPRRTGSARR